MSYRLSKIYTRTGDDGTTGLGDGSRVAKDDVRVQAYGDIDELNSHIGLILTQHPIPEAICHELTKIQHDLFDVGGELCIPGSMTLTDGYRIQLEQWIDQHNKSLHSLKEFILPGGSLQAAHCHVARTICRRTERAMVALHRREPINLFSLKYINRLSDYLFVLARKLNQLENITEPLWHSQRVEKLKN